MNTYYLIVNIIEDTTRETYRLFISAASYREEWLKVWNEYDPKKKREMFNNMLSTVYIQEENALESAKNGKFQNEEDYWNHMLQLYTFKGSISPL